MKRIFVAVTVSEEVKDRIKPVLDELAKTGADLKLVSVFNLLTDSFFMYLDFCFIPLEVGRGLNLL